MVGLGARLGLVDRLQRRSDMATKLDECCTEGTLIRGEMAADDLAIDAEIASDAEDLTEDVRGVVEVLVTVRNAGVFLEKAAIGLDLAGVAAIVDELDRCGFTSDHLRAIPQGWKLSRAIKGAARKASAWSAG